MKKSGKTVRFKYSSSLILMILLLAVVTLHAMLLQSLPVYAQAESISDSVLRLRVIANSNQKEDQELKLSVKNRLCQSLKPLLDTCTSKEEASARIRENMNWIQQEADSILNELTGSSQTECTVQLTGSLFPIRTYGNLTFPPGSYDTLLVTLGEGKGKNWWCVLYPSLCFTDETTASFSEEAEKKLQKSLSEADFSALNEGVTFQLKIAEVFEDLYYTLFSD
ncbi:MAG: stage II sporulation protein R [Lachnospiraceae bacterium]